jgi:hypothetical protein
MRLSELFHHKEKGSRAYLLLLLLLSGDFIFTAIHIVRHTFLQSSALWVTRLTASMDGYHILKLFLVIVLFTYLIIITRSSGYIAWLLVFTYLLIDDAFLIHQNIGENLAARFHAHFFHGLYLPSRFFELAVLAIIGLFLGIIVFWTYIRSSVTFRKISKDILLFILALIFFGAIVDLATVLKLEPAAKYFLGFVEDSGEMIVFSLILWYIFLVTLRNRLPELFLCDLIPKRNINEPR